MLPSKRKLDRLVPPDWDHYSKYPFAATEVTGPLPVVVAFNWYTNFDHPVKDSQGRYWIGKGDLGSIRGGHCTGLRIGQRTDLAAWWTFYDQGQEGACVGFGCTREQTLVYRYRFDAPWLYHEAQKIGGYVGQEGAYLRDGLKVLATEGHKRLAQPAPELKYGIKSYSWASSAEEVLTALGNKVASGLNAVPILNSWGRDYPHVVYMPAETLDRMLSEDGEAAILSE